LMVETVAKQFVTQNDTLMIAEFDVNSELNQSAIAVAKNGGAFLETVNGILKEMIDSGKIEELIQVNTQLMEDNTAE